MLPSPNVSTHKGVALHSTFMSFPLAGHDRTTAGFTATTERSRCLGPQISNTSRQAGLSLMNVLRMC